MKGKLIVIFGIDGSGKSTILSKLKDNMDNSNIVCMPSAGDDIFTRQLSLAEEKLNFLKHDYFAQGFITTLHISNVVYNIFNKVIPLLDEGKTIILDRYALCRRAYLECFSDVDYFCMANMLQCLPEPDLGLYFDVTIENALKRIQIREGKPYKYAEGLVTLKNKYEALLPFENYEIVKINANLSPFKVYSDVLTVIMKLE